jgi:Flp pilus assembly pilin Flp
MAAPAAVLASRAFRWRGQGVVEYGLILGLSAVVAVTVLVFFGGTLALVLDAIGEAIEQAS